MRSLGVALLVIMTVSAAAAQKPPIAPAPQDPIPEPNQRGKSREYPVSVTGCIQGKWLHVSDLHTRDSAFEALRVSDFVLEGPRELLRQIKDYHSGHHDEIEGIAIVPPSPVPSSATVTTKKFGKTHVTVAGREEGKQYVEEPRKPIVLKVQALTHVSEGCSGR